MREDKERSGISGVGFTQEQRTMQRKLLEERSMFFESYGSPEDLVIAVATLHHEVSSKDVASGIQEKSCGLGHSKHSGCQEHTASVQPAEQTESNHKKSQIIQFTFCAFQYTPWHFYGT